MAYQKVYTFSTAQKHMHPRHGNLNFFNRGVERTEQLGASSAN